jgi:hypothetical protein
MQVTDSQASIAAGSAGTGEVGSAGDEPGHSDRARPGKGFRDTLERRRRTPTGGDGAPQGTSAAAMTGWFRAEPGPMSTKAVAANTTMRPEPVAGGAAVDRVLIGSGPDGAQARIRIGAGALAGTEIHLSGGAGGRAVEARLLTHEAASRQTLSVVMDEIRSRLRGRGIALSIKAPGAVAAAAGDGNAITDDPPASPPAGAAKAAR